MSEPITIEVAALLGDSVVDVKHCIDPRSGKLTRTTLAWLATAAVALALAAIAFGIGVHTAAQNRRALDGWTRAQRPAYAFRPALLPAGDDVIAFGGLALAIVAAGIGLARAAAERRSPFYRIGTAPGVELPMRDAPAADFPLVAPSGDGFALTYTPEIAGAMSIGDAVTPLAQLAGRPSVRVPGALELHIPPDARIHATIGRTAFAIAAMPPPRRHAMPPVAFERRAAICLGASLAAHLLLLALIAEVPAEDSSASIDLGGNELVAIESSSTAHDDAVPPPETDADSAGGGPTGAAALDTPAAAAATPRDAKPAARLADSAAARAQAIAAARTSGILDSISAETFDGVAMTGDLAAGFDETPLNGGGIGDFGEATGGAFGDGRSGFGGGGPGWGTIASGHYGTCSSGHCAGGTGDLGPGGTGTVGLHRRRAGVPVVDKLGATDVQGDSGPIIRRYIHRNLDKITYCYEKELLARPALAGEIVAQFYISEGGSVTASAATGFDPTVASCIADVIAHIEFPHLPGGATVRYPLEFRPT